MYLQLYFKINNNLMSTCMSSNISQHTEVYCIYYIETKSDDLILTLTMMILNQQNGEAFYLFLDSLLA